MQYFLQYNHCFFNCELQYLKLINLELYQLVEPFWHDKMYCQFVIVVLIRVEMNLIWKIFWRIIIDKKQEYLDSQYNYTLQQNTKNKERELKTMQESARKQISSEVKNTAPPIVYNLA